MSKLLADKIKSQRINKDMTAEEIFNIAVEIKKDIDDGYYDDSQMLNLIDKNVIIVEELSRKNPLDVSLFVAWSTLFICGIAVRADLEKETYGSNTKC